MLLSNGLEQAEGGLHPRLLTISLDAPRRNELHRQLGLAIQRAKRAATPLEAQFRIREESRRIARSAYGDRQLAAARRHLAQGGIVLWDELPISDQRSPDADNELLTFGQAMIAVIAQGTTESFGFVQEDGGRHFQRLYPVAGVVNSGKTCDSLLPHVDNAMLVPWAQPQAIHLICVNNDARTATNFFSMGAVLHGLLDGFGASVVNRLREPAYVTALSNSFAGDPSAKSITTRARPILYRRRGQGLPTRFLGKGYDMGVAPDIDNRAEYEHALAAYQQVLIAREDLAFSITALPGQAVSFNQQRLLHGRGPITPGKYREMVRAYGRFSFSQLQARIGHLPPHYVFDGIQLVDR